MTLQSVEISWVQVSEHAPWSRRDSMGHLVYDGKMWILGGFEPQRTNDVWSSNDGENWRQVTTAAGWPPRNLPSCLVYNGKMWIMGGGDQIERKSVSHNDVWNSTDGVNWDRVTPNAAWSARAAASAVVFDGKMWILGGMDAPYGRAHNHDVWFSTDGINWEQATDYAPWSPRAMHSSVVFDGRMWVIGGGVYDESHYGNTAVDHGDVWYSTDGKNWSEATGRAEWPARRFHKSVVYDGKMWVIGGRHHGNRNDVWCSSDGENWSKCANGQAWSVRHEPACLVFRDKLWLLGGLGRSYTTTSGHTRRTRGSTRSSPSGDGSLAWVEVCGGTRDLPRIRTRTFPERRSPR